MTDADDIDAVVETDGGRLPTRAEAIVRIFYWAIAANVIPKAGVTSWGAKHRTVIETLKALGVDPTEITPALDAARRQTPARRRRPGQ